MPDLPASSMHHTSHTYIVTSIDLILALNRIVKDTAYTYADGYVSLTYTLTSIIEYREK